MKKSFSCIFLLIFAFFLIRFPVECFNAAQSSLELWLFTIIPSLWPFMIISDMLINNNHLNFAWLGFLSGYPMGAKFVVNSRSRYKYPWLALALFNMVSPNFVVTYVCVGLLHNAVLAIPLLLIVWGSTLAGCGIVFCCLNIKTKYCSRSFHNNAIPHLSNNNPLNSNTPIILKEKQNTSSLIVSSMHTLIVFCYYIMFYSILINIINKIVSNNLLTCIISILLEFTTGLRNTSNLPLICFSLTAGCFSVYSQTYEIVRGSGISLTKYISVKVFCGIIAYLFASIFFS